MTIYEDFYDTEGEALVDDNDRDKYLLNKYIQVDKRNNVKGHIEIKYANENVNQESELFKLISKNNYHETKKYFKLGNTIFKNDRIENIISIKSLCVKNKCNLC